MFIVNGESINVNQPVSLAKFLQDNNYDKKRIAVEVNGVIVSRSQYTETYLKNCDRVEIVSFVGGG